MRLHISNRASKRFFRILQFVDFLAKLFYRCVSSGDDNILLVKLSLQFFHAVDAYFELFFKRRKTSFESVTRHGHITEILSETFNRRIALRDLFLEFTHALGASIELLLERFETVLQGIACRGHVDELLAQIFNG